ncbi:MAG: response regulator transcription factor, partial [Planctomycetaceae bacterium]|nr:response regulator transcription factor [Planctomycetaceae bacterium]
MPKKKNSKRPTSAAKSRSTSGTSKKKVVSKNPASVACALSDDRSTKSLPQTSAAKTQLTRVMIVDDHELMRFGLKELMAGQPDLTVCGEASDHQDALRTFEETAPDLLICDVSLKTSNGLELVKTIKAKCPGIRIIVLSMFDENLYAERALRAGAVAFVSKQQPSRAILDAIRTVLAGEIYLSDKMTRDLLQRAVGQHAVSPLSPVELLSDRELEIFQLLGTAASTVQIAKA